LTSHQTKRTFEQLTIPQGFREINKNATKGNVMKDLLVRILVSAIVGSIVSASILYFSFDQALRGLETAVGVQSSAIGEANEWSRALDGKISTMEGKLDARADEIVEKLEKISSDISINERDAVGCRFVLLSSLMEFRGELSASVRTTTEITGILQTIVPTESPDFVRLVALVDRLKQHEASLMQIDFEALGRTTVQP